MVKEVDLYFFLPFESDISLLAPTAALLAKDVTEIGARMGIAYAIAGECSLHCHCCFRCLPGFALGTAALISKTP